MTPRRHWMEVGQTASGFTQMNCYLCGDDFRVLATNGDPINFTLEPSRV